MDEKEIVIQFLQELDAFYDEWSQVFKKNNTTTRPDALLQSYAIGELSEISELPIIRFCPVCKQRPIEMNVYEDALEDGFIENNQEFLQRFMFCKCKKNENWKVTYKLLPIKIEEDKEEE
jgi:hypothetical protein